MKEIVQKLTAILEKDVYINVSKCYKRYSDDKIELNYELYSSNTGTGTSSFHTLAAMEEHLVSKYPKYKKRKG